MHNIGSNEGPYRDHSASLLRMGRGLISNFSVVRQQWNEIDNAIS